MLYIVEEFKFKNSEDEGNFDKELLDANHFETKELALKKFNDFRKNVLEVNKEKGYKVFNCARLGVIHDTKADEDVVIDYDFTGFKGLKSLIPVNKDFL